MRVPVNVIREKVSALHEFNPMLGHRGCRLGIVYPEITRMQARAIFEAACTVAARKGRVQPEVMIPLTSTVVEFRRQALIIRQVAEEVFRERQLTVPYLLGTMIELPRAALTADEIAREAQFFSFGTNDLTQTTWGLSRDDAGSFLPYYIENGIIPDDPFQVLDQSGVGKLISMACDLGRRTRQDLKLGICGEHGGEPAAIGFCDDLGMNYVSCSPFRVPIARLAAAQAALAKRGTMDRTKATV
jgi:pyruvate,orthophosphate dikinase